MSLSAVYHIIERYEADTARAEQAVQRLGKQTGETGFRAEMLRKDLARLDAQAERLTQRFGGLKMALTAAVGIGVGLGIKSMVAGLSELEQATQGVAGAFLVNDAVRDFDDGMRRAEGAVQRFRRMAKDSPGDTRDFLSIYSTMLPVMLQAKRGDAAMEELVKRGVFLKGLAPQSSYDEIAQSMGMVLGGAAGQDTVVWRMLQKQLGGDVQAWNKMAKEDPGRAFDRLSQALAGLDAVAARSGQSFGGLLATLSDVKDQTLMAAGEGLFEALKDDMQDLATWAEKNEGAIKNWARSIGQDLVGAYNLLKGPAQFAADNAGALMGLWALSQGRQMAGGMRGIGIGMMTGGERDPDKAAARLARGWRLGGMPGDDVSWSREHGYHRMVTERDSSGLVARDVQRAERLTGMDRARAEYIGFKGAAGRGLDVAGRALGAIGTIGMAADVIYLTGKTIYDAVDRGAFNTGEGGELMIAQLKRIGETGKADWRELSGFGVRSQAEADYIAEALRGYMAPHTGPFGSGYQTDSMVVGEKDALFERVRKAQLGYQKVEEDRIAQAMKQIALVEQLNAEILKAAGANARWGEPVSRFSEKLSGIGVKSIDDFASAASGAASKIAMYNNAFNRFAEIADSRNKWAAEKADDFLWRSLGWIKPPKVHVGPVTIKIERATNPERIAILTRDVLLRAAVGAPRTRAGNGLNATEIHRGW